MQRLLRLDEELEVLKKPPLEPVRALELEETDSLILCAGFEERALGMLKSAIANSERFNVVVVEYLPFVPENRIEEINGVCEMAHLEVRHLTYDRQNPSGFGDRLVEEAARFRGR